MYNGIMYNSMEDNKGGKKVDIYTRVENLENLVNGLIERIDNSKYYTDADINGVRQNITEIEKAMYPDWVADGYDYLTSERVTYEGKYYRCLQSHKSQPDWTPDTAVSLWVEIADTSIEWPEWKQPSGAHDAYNKGDKVSHNDKHWISDIDANVYEPSVYGWSEA